MKFQLFLSVVYSLNINQVQMLYKFSSRNAALLFLPLVWIINSTDAISQSSSDNSNVSFGIQAYDPVHIKVEEREGSAVSSPIRFTALNSTYYPFLLQIDFIQFENLAPTPPAREIEVSHGVNNLYTFSVHVPGIGYGYRYTYRYWLSPSAKTINEEFPYLIPLKEGTKVTGKRTFYGKVSDSFTGKAGDTVFAMRRGFVTAVPRSETLDFRLSGHDCLEVLQEDGTYMIYHNLNKTVDLTDPGKTVLPGQPIGILSDSSFLMVTLIKIGETKNLTVPLPIKYTTGNATPVSFDEIEGIASVHPWNIITKEMKEREIKKAGKNRKN